MNSEKKCNAGVAKSFSTPLFLVIAIIISALLVVSVVSAVMSALDTLEMLGGVSMAEDLPLSEIITGTVSIPAILGIIFLIVSTVCAWLLYAKGYSSGKVLNVRLHLAYSKIMNTISIVFISIIGAVLVAACVGMTIVTDMVSDEIIPWLEEDIRPALDEMIEYKEEFEKSDVDFDEMFAEMDEATKESLGITDVQEMKDIFMEVGEFAEEIDSSWDAIIEFVETGFLTLTIIVAAVYVLLIVALCFVSSGLKRTSKYLRALSENDCTEVKAPKVAPYLGGAVCAIGGIAALFLAPMTGITWLLQGALLILFAIFFKQLEGARASEIAVAEGDVSVAEDVTAVESSENADEGETFDLSGDSDNSDDAVSSDVDAENE